jgi:ACS family hexuronate transporter-like MFS transporter
MSATPSPWRWSVCVMLLLASTLNYMDRQALNQTAKRLQDAFGINDRDYGYVESIFTIGFAVGTLTTGWIVDRVNVRWVYPLAVLGWSAFGFLTGFAPGYWFLFFCRFGLGVFEAGNWPCGIRTVRQVMPPSQRALGNAFFQNGTAIGAIVTPLIVLACLEWAGPDTPNVWQVPFRVIGLVGLVWVALWFIAVPAKALTPVTDDTPRTDEATSFTALFRDRRFWLLVLLVVAVNTSWHTFRVWLPLYLQRQQGFTEKEMQYFSVLYYVVADAGAWVVGLGGLALVWLGMGLHNGRMALFALCAALVMGGVMLPLVERGPAQTAVLLAFGFGAYGLFPTYFTLSQELSARHQGKVTGTLGCINALYLSAMYPIEGQIAVETKRYDLMMAAAGFPALGALIAIALMWPRGPKPT